MEPTAIENTATQAPAQWTTTSTTPEPHHSAEEERLDSAGPGRGPMVIGAIVVAIALAAAIYFGIHWRSDAQHDLKADWRSVMSAPPEALVNALAMLCPFEPPEKQALLEAPGWRERVDTLVALLEMSAAMAPGNTSLN